MSGREERENGYTRRNWSSLWSRLKTLTDGRQRLSHKVSGLWHFTVNNPTGSVFHITGIPPQNDSMYMWCGFWSRYSSARQNKTLRTARALCKRWFYIMNVKPQTQGVFETKRKSQQGLVTHRGEWSNQNWMRDRESGIRFWRIRLFRKDFGPEIE